MSVSRSRSTSRTSLSPLRRHPPLVLLPAGIVAGPSVDQDQIKTLETSETAPSTRVANPFDEGGQKTSHGKVQDTGRVEIYAVEEDEEEILEKEEMMKRPFYRRPSPWWMSGLMLLSAIAMSTTIAPRVELYTALACRAIKPELIVEDYQSQNSGRTVPPPSEKCGKDPDVQAAVAQLITIMTVSAGIFACLTTGWWGQLADRYGRTRILGIATIGLLATDLVFILGSLAANRVPGGYRFLMISGFGGLLGGMGTLIACMNAYVSDCTPTEQRSRVFSFNSGLMFCGMALGPALGGLCIHSTNDLLSVFYLAGASHLFYGLFILLAVPESLPKSSMRKIRKRRENLHIESVATGTDSRDQGGISIKKRARRLFGSLFTFLAPLRLFIPAPLLEGKGRNWNLLLLALSHGFSMLIMGSYQFKFQYAQRTFGWNSEQLGYWLSVVSTVRALYLVFLLPLVIKFLEPKNPPPIQLPVSPSEPLDPSTPSSESAATPESNPSLFRRRHTAFFDLGILRVSLAIELCSYIGMSLATSSPAWIVASVMSSLGAGASPAMYSVALALYEQSPNTATETGRLFGGLSVVQSLSSQVIGPSVFGLTYVSTVNTFPKGIFAVAAAAVVCALFCTSFIRIVRDTIKTGHDREEATIIQEDS